jgi:hypothetical protein
VVDLSRAFEADPGSPTPGAQASASENDGSHAAVAQGTHHSKVIPVIDVCRLSVSVNTVELESHLLDDSIIFVSDDLVFF